MTKMVSLNMKIGEILQGLKTLKYDNVFFYLMDLLIDYHAFVSAKNADSKRLQ